MVGKKRRRPAAEVEKDQNEAKKEHHDKAVIDLSSSPYKR